jgi:hypothetical protein
VFVLGFRDYRKESYRGRRPDSVYGEKTDRLSSSDFKRYSSNQSLRSNVFFRGASFEAGANGQKARCTQDSNHYTIPLAPASAHHPTQRAAAFHDPSRGHMPIHVLIACCEGNILREEQHPKPHTARSLSSRVPDMNTSTTARKFPMLASSQGKKTCRNFPDTEDFFQHFSRIQSDTQKHPFFAKTFTSKDALIREKKR